MTAAIALIVMTWRRRYAFAPSSIAPAISLHPLVAGRSG